jgi:AraC-like DNA-binding protein
MIFAVKADLIALVRGLIEGLQPFAQAHGVSLSLTSEFNQLVLLYQPEEIVPDLTQLLCRVITFTPQGYAVQMRINTCPAETNCLDISVANTGVSLALMGDIRKGIRYEVMVESQQHGSKFIIRMPINGEKHTQMTADTSTGTHAIIKPWYSEIRKHLTTHFKNPKNLEEAAENRSEQEGIFLKKAHAIIEGHMDQEGFTAKDLANAMALSSTQLFRKIRSLTHLAPGRYIRLVRLLKARDLLQSGHYNVSEVAGKVGFVSNSHFTRAFQKQFGINPSSLK